MWKRIRELQPAHEGGSFTVEEAARAFRQVRGSAPKLELFDDNAIVRCDASGQLMIYDPGPAAAVVAEFEKTRARKPPARMAYRKGVLQRW